MKRGCYNGCPKGLSMICSIPFPGVLVAKPLRVSMPPVCLFSNIDHFPSISYIVSYCTNSCSAHHSRACDLPLACSQLFLQVKEVCRLFRNQKIKMMNLSDRVKELGDEHMKAPTG